MSTDSTTPEGTEEWHGTLNGYSNRKCRGPRCRAAWAKYVADRKEERKQADTPPHVHGTANGYNNWGCSCDACTSAWADAERGRRERRALRAA